MFNCERCGSSFNGALGITLENCPRCLLREEVAAPLKFKIFDSRLEAEGDSEPGAASPPSDQSAGEESTREAVPQS
jgi:hypothetical protein